MIADGAELIYATNLVPYQMTAILKKDDMFIDHVVSSVFLGMDIDKGEFLYYVTYEFHEDDKSSMAERMRFKLQPNFSMKRIRGR